MWVSGVIFQMMLGLTVGLGGLFFVVAMFEMIVHILRGWMEHLLFMDTLAAQPADGAPRTFGQLLQMGIVIFMVYSASWLLMETLLCKMVYRLKTLGGMVSGIVRPIPTINMDGEPSPTN